jgi:hypothetical protein
MTKLCARGKAAAKRKFKVYPSAYANAYASKICAGKIKDPSGKKKKDWGPKKMNTGGEMDYGKQKKEKMKTKPYGIEDRKVKIEKLMSQKEIEKLKKEGGFGKYARPESEKKNTSAGKTAPPKYAVGGGADISTMKKKKKKPAPGGGRERHEYMKNIQNPKSEYDEKGKLKYTAVKGGGIAIKGTNFKGVF